MEMILSRTPGTAALAPVEDADIERVKKLRPGALIRCTVHRIRNAQFHRKYFALLRVGFDLWSEYAPPVIYRGQRVQPDFTKFRRDLVILCGFYRVVPNLFGEPRMEPESISFSKMDQARFEELYSKTINVLLARVIPGGVTSEAKIRESVDAILAFGS